MGIAGVEPAPPDYETDTLPLRHTPSEKNPNRHNLIME
jgi:hypothetical protein